MRRVGHTSEFLFGIYWWTWKTTIPKKTVKVANKKSKYFSINNVVFFKKNNRKTPGDIIILHLCTENLDDMIYSFWEIECDRLKLVIMGHYLSFPPLLKTQKIRILKKMKNCRRYHHFTRLPKTTIIWCTVPEICRET